jgi:hypothetical protein
MNGSGWGGTKWGGGPWGDGHRRTAVVVPPGGGGGETPPPTSEPVLPLTLEEMLAAYVFTPPVQEVDALVATYRQRGADRALTALLECRFQDVFGMGADTSSHAGALMAGLREMARTTLPVDKYGRAPVGTQTLLSSAPERDPEYTLTDQDQEEAVEIPSG